MPIDLEYTSVEEIDKVRHNKVVQFYSLALTLSLWQHYAALRAGFKSGKLRSVAYRKYQLLQLLYLVRDNDKRFAAALTSDLGRPELECYL